MENLSAVRFMDSGISRDDLKELFESSEVYKNASAGFYFEKLDLFSTDSNKRTRVEWLVTARRIVLNDVQEQKLVEVASNPRQVANYDEDFKVSPTAMTYDEYLTQCESGEYEGRLGPRINPEMRPLGDLLKGIGNSGTEIPH